MASKARHGQAGARIQPAKVKAIGLSGHFGALYAAVFNAMHEEDGEAGGSSAEFDAAFEGRFNAALKALKPVDADARQDVLAELVSATILYWCLRGSLDRPQKFSVVNSRLHALRDQMVLELSRLDALEEKSASAKHKRQSGQEPSQRRGANDVAYEKEFMTEWEVRREAVVVDGLVRSRLFELQARQYLRLALRRLDALLGPVIGLRVPAMRGQPRKYSKDFLILRCLRLFRKYKGKGGITRRKEGVKAWAKVPAYDGPLVSFIRLVVRAVDPSVNLDAQYGLGKSIEDAGRLLVRYPHADELVRQNSSDEELLMFMTQCQTIRTNATKPRKC